jgi:dTDP-4-amino-4,6-dideoxygalactose transaminase
VNLSIPFFRPLIDENDKKALSAVLESGWLSSGPKVIEFEGALAEFLGVEPSRCLAVNSATAGLHLAADALNFNESKTIAIPTMTFTATAEILRYQKANIIFLDSNSDDPNVSLNEIERFSKEIDGIVPVHFTGIPLDIQSIRNILGGNKSIIEDAAHAFGSKYFDGNWVGNSIADATVFSFYANKNLTTGEGGLLVSKSQLTHDRAKLMRTHGLDRDAHARYGSSAKANSWEYDVLEAGYKYNMTDSAAALGISQLEKFEQGQKRRLQLTKYYLDQFKDLPLLCTPMVNQLDRNALHLFTIQIPLHSRISREDFIEEMRESGIGTSVHYKPLHLMSYWKKFVPTGQKFPNAEKRFRTTISLPLYPALSDSESERVAEAVINLTRKF